MTSLPPDQPERLLRAPGGDSVALPVGWQIDPRPLSSSKWAQVEALPTPCVWFSVWDELPPRDQSETEESWTSPPTPLRSRRLSGPWRDRSGRYEAVMLTLHPSRRDAELAAAARVVSEGQFVHRTIVELEAMSLEVIDARGLEELTNSALVAKDGQAWQLFRAIRDHFDAEAIWITNSNGNEDVIVLFIDSIGKTVYLRDEAIYEFDSQGNARCLSDGSRPGHDVCASSHVRRWVADIAIAVSAALVAHPIFGLAEELIGINITVPGIVPALLGLGAGIALARLLTRRRRLRRRD